MYWNIFSFIALNLGECAKQAYIRKCGNVCGQQVEARFNKAI
jgi:hypothetical protein